MNARQEGVKKYWEKVRMGLAESPNAIRKKNKEKKLNLQQPSYLVDGKLQNETPSHEVLNAASFAITGEHLATKAKIIEAASSFDRETGVYFLLNKGEIVYIGQSVHVRTRVDMHRQEKKIEFDAVAYVLCDKKDLDFLESMYIYKFSPCCNGNTQQGSKAAPVSIQQIYDLIKDKNDAKRTTAA